MARIKIDLPGQFSFSTNIPIRITDINYGGHVGNDSILSIMQEARMQYFSKHGYTELDLGGVGSIMTDVGIEYKNEIFYADSITVSVTAGDFSKYGFDLFYKIEKTNTDGNTLVIAKAKTGIVCYDYKIKKIALLPESVQMKLKDQ